MTREEAARVALLMQAIENAEIEGEFNLEGTLDVHGMDSADEQPVARLHLSRESAAEVTTP